MNISHAVNITPRALRAWSTAIDAFLTFLRFRGVPLTGKVQDEVMAVDPEGNRVPSPAIRFPLCGRRHTESPPGGEAGRGESMETRKTSLGALWAQLFIDAPGPGHKWDAGAVRRLAEAAIEALGGISDELALAYLTGAGSDLALFADEIRLVQRGGAFDADGVIGQIPCPNDWAHDEWGIVWDEATDTWSARDPSGEPLVEDCADPAEALAELIEYWGAPVELLNHIAEALVAAAALAYEQGRLS